MNIILYTIDCPKCIILEKKLKMANIDYRVCKDIEVMRAKNFRMLPILEVNGVNLAYKGAIDWIGLCLTNSKEGRK